MITAQDIREKGFEKANIRDRGYDMAAVDDFLEEIADEIANSQKENAVLKSKMKVLVDKIEEYRANEEALNMAVLSAQKLAVQIEADARARAAAMLADADRQVQATVGSIESRANEEERRLADAKAATAAFLEDIRSMCTAQQKNIEAIAAGYAPARSSDEDIRVADVGVQSAADASEPDTAPAKLLPRQRRLDSTQPFSL